MPNDVCAPSKITVGMMMFHLGTMNRVKRMAGADVTMESFVMQHGRPWIAQKRPKGMRRRAPRQCFANSQEYLLVRLATTGLAPFKYVEGFAYHSRPGFSLSIHHGWLVDEEGQVIDLTWEHPEDSVYVGVPFHTKYVRDRMLATKQWHTLLDDYRDSYALLRGVTPLEQAVLPLTGWPAYEPSAGS